jgi:hypothetical protein
MEMELLSSQAAAGLLSDLLGHGKNWVTVLADARRPVQRRSNTLFPICSKPMLYREPDVRDFAAAELALAAERKSGGLVVEGDSELEILVKLTRIREPLYARYAKRGPAASKGAPGLTERESEELDEALDRAKLAKLLLTDLGLSEGD